MQLPLLFTYWFSLCGVCSGLNFALVCFVGRLFYFYGFAFRSAWGFRFFSSYSVVSGFVVGLLLLFGVIVCGFVGFSLWREDFFLLFLI